jgi:hypothetical protein
MTPPDTAPDAAASQTDIEDLQPSPIRASTERKGNPVACPECGVEVTHLRRHLKKVHPTTGKAAPPRTRANRSAEARSGELWARCPECRVPVKDVELFKHLLNCPGAEVRRAEWAAQQATAAINASAVEPDVQQ